MIFARLLSGEEWQHKSSRVVDVKSQLCEHLERHIMERIDDTRVEESFSSLVSSSQLGFYKVVFPVR